METKSDLYNRILEAAARKFAESSLPEARVGHIAEQAGVRTAYIYDHLGGKEDLYRLVLDELGEDMAKNLLRKVKTADSPEDKLRGYIHGLNYFLDNNQLAPPLILRDAASGGLSLSGSGHVLHRLLVGILTAIIEEGQSRGVFGSLNPLLVYYIIIGSTVLLKTRSSIPAESDLGLYQRNPGSVSFELEELILKAVKL